MDKVQDVKGGVCCICRAPLINHAFVFFLTEENSPELCDIYFTCDTGCGEAAEFPLDKLNSYWTDGRVDLLLDRLDFIFPRQSERIKQRIAEARALLKHTESFYPDAKFQDLRIEMDGSAQSVAAEMFRDIPVRSQVIGIMDSAYRNYIEWQGRILPSIAAKGCVNFSLDFSAICKEVYQRVNNAPAEVAYGYLSELYDIIDIRPDKGTACNQVLGMLKQLKPELQELAARGQFLENCREMLAATLPRKKFRP